MDDCFWSLCWMVERVRVDGLRTAQMQALLRAIGEEQLPNWLVWQEGTPSWVPATDVRERIAGAAGLKAMPPAPPPLAGGGASMGGAGAAMELETIPEQGADPKAMDRRAAARFLIPLKVFVTIGGRLCANETIDVSIGGMKLKNPLPAAEDDMVDAILMNGTQELYLKCQVRQGEHPRLIIVRCARSDVLRSWILGHPEEGEPVESAG